MNIQGVWSVGRTTWALWKHQFGICGHFWYFINLRRFHCVHIIAYTRKSYNLGSVVWCGAAVFRGLDIINLRSLLSFYRGHRLDFLQGVHKLPALTWNWKHISFSWVQSQYKTTWWKWSTFNVCFLLSPALLWCCVIFSFNVVGQLCCLDYYVHILDDTSNLLAWFVWVNVTVWVLMDANKVLGTTDV